MVPAASGGLTVPSSVPYRCPECMRPGACGYHGILVFDNEIASDQFRPPVCDHHKPPARGSRETPAQCHQGPITMVPVR